MANKYRELYKKHYGIKFGKDFVVHHIDEDRTNNKIENLILLPSELHSKYHICKIMFKHQMTGGFDCSLTYSAMCRRTLQIAYLDEFLEVLNELQKWITYKYLADMGHDSYSMFEKR